MKLLIQIPANRCVLNLRVVNDKSSVSGILFYMSRKPIDFIPAGSRLTYIKKVSQIKALYRCICGGIKEIDFNLVKSGRTRSCGCLVKEGSAKSRTHGLTNHPLYNKWEKMRARCNNPNNKDYKLYGGRGVRVCEEWQNEFMPFYNWCINNGWKKGLELDKDYIPNKLGIEAKLYSPAMCCFLTQKENSNYRRNNHFITYNGKSLNLKQWENELGLNDGILSQRLKLGWDIERALTTPMIDMDGKRSNVILLYSEGLTMRQISAKLKMCRKTISKIIKDNK